MNIHYECLRLCDGDGNEYFITPENFLNLTMGKGKFQTVPKRTRTWIEPIIKPKPVKSINIGGQKIFPCENT